MPENPVSDGQDIGVGSTFRMAGHRNKSLAEERKVISAVFYEEIDPLG